MKVCRICLSKDGRLHPITSNGFRSLYHHLLGVLKLEVDVDRRLPQWVCAECGLRLMSYNKLRQKSLRSHQILISLLGKRTHIAEEDINQIDREKNDLQSTLSYCVLINGNNEDNVVELKPKQQIKEFINDKEIDELAMGFKTVMDTYNHSEIEVPTTVVVSDALCHPSHSCFVSHLDKDVATKCNNTELSNTENNSQTKDSVNNSECDSDIVSYLEDPTSESESSDNKLQKKTICTKSLKRRSKTTQFDLKRHVNKYMNVLNKKTNKSDKKRLENDVKINRSQVIEDLFSIRVLSWEEQIEEFERRKNSNNFTESPFKCNDCFQGFVSQVTFARHKLKHSDEAGKIECKICKMRFRLKKSYWPHMKAHTTVYSCNECGFTTKQRSVVTQHRLKHKGQIYKCTHCSSEFACKSSYLGHLRLKHVSQFVCEYCGYSFVSAIGVGHHKNKIHALENHKLNDASPSCATCNIKFVKDEALSTHLRVSHSITSDDHKNTYNEVRYAKTKKCIICELCGVKTAHRRAYKGHFSEHHPDESPNKFPPRKRSTQQFVCEQCGRVFQAQATLQAHALVHTEQRPFECHDCHKRFKSKYRVQQHIVLVHLPKKHEGYACGICGKDFSSKANRKRHVLRHTSVRAFNCNICGSTFKSKEEVNSHTRHVHMNVPWPRKRPRGKRPAY